jgi:hypothetical protein
MPIVTTTQNPTNHAQNIAVNTPIYVSYGLSGDALEVGTKIYVNGENVYDDTSYTEPTKLAFKRPNWYGKVIAEGSLVSFTINARRQYLYGVKVSVIVDLSLTSGLIRATDFDFFIQPVVTKITVPELKRTAVNNPLTNYPGVYALQQALQRSLVTPVTFSFSLVLLRRIVDSPLRAYLRSFQLPTVVKNDLNRLLPEELGATNNIVTALDAVAPFWDIALNELYELGVKSEDLEIFNNHWISNNAINRIAAAAFVVSLAANLNAGLRVVL